MLKHICIGPFVFGVVLGIIGFFFISPSKTVTYKYPTPQDQGNVIYKDKNGTCYRYQAKEVDCDKNEATLKDFPLSR